MFRLLTISLAVSVAISDFASASTINLDDNAISTQNSPSAKNENSVENKTKQTVDEHIVVIGEHMNRPTTVVTNPKQPRLPLPAYDGAGYLRTIPGFSIGRKGGAGGDPSLRGLGGSRINIIDDGQHTYGTCGGRMDPPTAYVYPESYDSITVIKGPQTVKHGPVGSAGTVLFDKDRQSFIEPTTQGRASITGASFGRQDFIVELKGGDQDKYLDLEYNRSTSEHYEDGSGNKVQSKYDRNNAKVALGWTPTEETVVELSYGTSTGSAEYADRGNKGRLIENDNSALIVEHELAGEQIKAIDFQLYTNQTNHIMDQFDQGNNRGVNVRRATDGGHFWLDLTPAEHWQTTVGVDFMLSAHEARFINPDEDNGLDDLLENSFIDTLSYENYGLFLESENNIGTGNILTGLRYDRWETELSVAQQGVREDDLFSGFVRYELNQDHSQYYLGGGYAERIPDYWEFMKAEENSSIRAFALKPEKTSQIDLGWIYEDEIKISSALFYGKIKDYILIDASGNGTIAKNIDATIWGGEFGITAPITEHLSTQMTVSYSHGTNDSENRALGQVSPLEGRIALDYEQDAWSMGAYWRLVAAQTRAAIGQGNISGQDLAESSGFGTLSIFGGWKSTDNIAVTFGIENLLDKTYAEHISRSGGGNDVPGSEPMFQVNEPGRNIWMKMDYSF